MSMYGRGYKWPLSEALLLLSLLHQAQSGAVTNGLVDTQFTQDCFYNKSVDIVILLDGSGSVGDNTFSSQIEFAILFARRLNVSSEGTHLAIAQFSDESRLEFPLTQNTAISQLESAIHRIPFIGGATLTGKALDFVLNSAFEGARGDVPKVLVVLTDGQSQDNVVMPAQRIREVDITVYAVGITNLVNVHELHEIAGSDKRTFTVESLQEVDKPLVESITLDMCTTDFRPGEPEIICGHDHIGIRAATKDPFDGFVFVQDHFHDTECRAGAMDFKDPKMISLTIPFNKCNIHRYRSIDPRGIYVEATVVFMFHMTFMTKVDHMVKVQCFYMESDKTVSSPMEVSMIPTEFREKMYPMPTCFYTLRKGSPDGPELHFASIGDDVYHRWECLEVDNKDTFGMLVHSCYVYGGNEKKRDLINSKGCGIDPALVLTPEYGKSLRLASQHTHVFKYADRPVLQFQCQITLCVKYDGGCEGITPPQCPEVIWPGDSPKRRLRRALTKEEKTSGEIDSSLIDDRDTDDRSEDDENEALNHRKMATLDVFTKAITVFEDKKDLCSGSKEGILSWMDPLHIALITSFNILIALSSVIIWVFIFRFKSTRSVYFPR